jgi:hypothetical protein
MKRKTIFISIFFSFLLLAVSVNAAEGMVSNLLDMVLTPFGGLSIPDLYDKYSTLFDFVIYLILFIGLVKVAIGKLPQFDNRAGNSVVIVLGLALAVSLSWFGNANGFSLRNLGPLAMIIFALLLCFVVYNMIKSTRTKDEDKALLISGSYLFLYLMFIAILPDLWEWINEEVPFLAALLTLLFLIALIVVIIKIIRKLTGVFKGNGNAAATPEEQATKEEIDKDEEKIKRETEEAEKTSKTSTAREKRIKEITDEEIMNINTQEKFLDEISKLLRSLIAGFDKDDIKTVEETIKKIKESTDRSTVIKKVKDSIRGIRKSSKYSYRDINILEKQIWDLINKCRNIARKIREDAQKKKKPVDKKILEEEASKIDLILEKATKIAKEDIKLLKELQIIRIAEWEQFEKNEEFMEKEFESTFKKKVDSINRTTRVIREKGYTNNEKAAIADSIKKILESFKQINEVVVLNRKTIKDIVEKEEKIVQIDAAITEKIKELERIKY